MLSGPLSWKYLKNRGEYKTCVCVQGCEGKLDVGVREADACVWVRVRGCVCKFLESLVLVFQTGAHLGCFSRFMQGSAAFGELSGNCESGIANAGVREEEMGREEERGGNERRKRKEDLRIGAK